MPLEDRFGGGEGATPLGNISINVCTVFAPFFGTFLKNPKLCSTGLETGCKPVLLPLVMEKDEKNCFNAEINDQQMVCGAPVCWSKYTTPIL